MSADARFDFLGKLQKPDAEAQSLQSGIASQNSHAIAPRLSDSVEHIGIKLRYRCFAGFEASLVWFLWLHRKEFNFF